MKTFFDFFFSVMDNLLRKHLFSRYSAAAGMAEGGRSMVRQYLDLPDEEKKKISKLRLEFKSRYLSFKKLLQSNNNALENMASIEKQLQGNQPFSFSFINKKSISIAVDVFLMIKCLEEIAPGKYSRLYNSFDQIQDQIKSSLHPQRDPGDTRLTIPTEKVYFSMASLVGNKMAKLGEIKNNLNITVPNGFVITSNAYELVIKENRLEDEIAKQMQMINYDDISAIQRSSSIIQKNIHQASIPEKLQDDIAEALSALKKGSSTIRLALRSSALGEDSTKTSSAGQYLSRLNISDDKILETYKEIIASKYSTEAIIYRFNHGLIDNQILMAVGCMRMQESIAGGVIYTRNPVDAEDDGIYINSCWGLPKTVVEGDTACDHFIISREAPYRQISQDIALKPMTYVNNRDGGIIKTPVPVDEASKPSLTTKKQAELAGIAMRLEENFGKPQDIEWCIDNYNRVKILQCRPLTRLKRRSKSVQSQPTLVTGDRLIQEGGISVSSGIAFGKTFWVENKTDFGNFPDGAILVTKMALPRWAPLLSKAAGIIVEEGSFAGHLSNVAREFDVPALFGIKAIKDKLANGTLITLDADSKRVFRGKADSLVEKREIRSHKIVDSPVFEKLKEISRHIVPLNLIGPDSADFRPSKCRSLHDITRFIHEKSVAEMFNFGKSHHFSEHSGKQLYYKVPMQWWILNLDDGFQGEIGRKYVRLENIASIPMLALWDGIIAIPWEGPPPIDGKGFLSVMFQATTNSSLTASVRTKFADKNYFMISKNFCSLSSRLGFHFTTVEAIAGDKREENYISFQYKGGAADYKRRENRIRFLGDILENCGFTTKIQEDTLNARMENHELDYIKTHLNILGYLIIHTRQIDMIMMNTAAVSYYKSKFEKDIASLMTAANAN